MKTKLFGLDLGEEKIAKLEHQQELYNLEFTSFTRQSDLLTAIHEEIGLVVVAINLKTDTTDKYNLTAEISRLDNVIVIFVSEHPSTQERVRWVTYGSLLYILEPYDYEELIARTLYLSSKYKPNLIGTKDLYIDIKQRQIYYQGDIVKSTPRLFALMLYFVENEGRVVRREEIMKTVFGDHYLTDRSIDNFIKDIRKMFGSEIVRTVRGVGYIYDPNINL